MKPDEGLLLLTHLREGARRKAAELCRWGMGDLCTGARGPGYGNNGVACISGLCMPPGSAVWDGSKCAEEEKQPAMVGSKVSRMAGPQQAGGSDQLMPLFGPQLPCQQKMRWLF